MDVFDALKNKIERKYWICIISGMVFGLITHFYILCNKYTNWDDINDLETPGSTYYLGRWFLPTVHKIGTSFSNPVIHGVLYILFLSLAACLVLQILNLKTTTAAILVPMLMVSFPSVACTMGYMFMTHTSGIGIFMFALGVYLMREYRFGFIPGGVLFTFSLGIYQSFICFAICLILLGMISDINDGRNIIKTWIEAIASVIVLGVSTLTYMKLSHIIYPNLDNETYGGVGDMGQISVLEMPRLIGRAYKRILEYFITKPFGFVSDFMHIINVMVIILIVCFSIYLFIKKEMYKNIWTGLLYVLLNILVPLAAAFIYFMAPEVSYSMIMLYGYVLIYVMVLMLWEKSNTNKTISVLVAVVIFLSCYANFTLTETVYLRSDIAHKRVEAYFNRVITYVESIDGFEATDKMTLLGEYDWHKESGEIVSRFMGTNETRSLDGIPLENGLLTLGVRDKFIHTYIGYDVANLTYEEKSKLMDTEEYKNLKCFPSEGCVAKIGDIWVIKLFEN